MSPSSPACLTPPSHYYIVLAKLIKNLIGTDTKLLNISKTNWYFLNNSKLIIDNISGNLIIN